MTTRMKRAIAVAAGLGLLGAAGLLAGANETHTNQPGVAIKRSMPNGETDVIKAMGNTKWADIELKA